MKQWIRIGLMAALWLGGVLTGETGLRGRVVDARTGEPLERVRVEVAGSGRMVMTGAGGVFRIDGLPAGTGQLRISAPSYALLKYDVPTGDTELEVALQPDADSVKSRVVVRAGVFEGYDAAPAASEHTLNKAELGALGTSVIGDPLRSVQALPSVTASNDGRGEISVRGSSYERVGLMVDGVLLDGFLHQISTDTLGSDRDRASFSIVTPDRIAEVSLLNGAYGAEFGMRTAGLVRLTTRDGNRERRDFRVSTGLTLGTALVHDGPMAGKRGAYLAGVRSSALNPFRGGSKDEKVGFSDGQFKWQYDVTGRHRVGASVLLGEFAYEDKRAELAEGRNTVTKANSASLAVMANWEWTVGTGVVASTKLFQTQTGLNGLNRESIVLGRLPRKQWGGRQDWNIQAGRRGNVQLGTYVRSVEGQGNGLAFVGARQAAAVVTERYRGSTTEGNYYAQTTQEMAPHLRVTGGVRVETNRLSKEMLASPRLGLAWNPGAGQVTVRAGYGRHRQFADLGDLLSLAGNRGLRAELTDQYTTGAEVRMGERARLRVEAFARRDREQIFRLDEPRMLMGRVVEMAGRPANSVDGWAKGFEVMLQRRSGNRFSGWASYSFLRTRMRERSSGLVFPTDFDQRHTGSLFGASRISGTWSVNAVYRVATGTPYTGFVRRDGEGRYFLAPERNALLLRGYGRLDLRLNKTVSWRATRWSFVLEGLNLMNQGNVTFNGVRQYDGVSGQILNPVTLYGFTRTATAGVVVQF